MTATNSHSNIRIKARHGAAAAVAFIEEQIAQGVLKEGDQLPPERELVSRFGVSRNTLRRSLKELENAGKIFRHVGRGTFVRSERIVVHQNDALTQKIQRSSPLEVMDLRLMLEPQSSELAATRATANDFNVMKECLKGCENAASVAEFEQWDSRLHQAIVSAARNQLLSDLYEAIDGVRRSPEWGKLKERSLTAERRTTYLRQHRAIVDALRERDAERARNETRAHLVAVKNGLITI